LKQYKERAAEIQLVHQILDSISANHHGFVIELRDGGAPLDLGHDLLPQ
jgi:hypothetical protein